MVGADSSFDSFWFSIPPNIGIPEVLIFTFFGAIISIPPKIVVQLMDISLFISTSLKSNSTPPNIAIQLAPLKFLFAFSSILENNPMYSGRFFYLFFGTWFKYD